MTTILLETSGGNLLLGYMPEPLGLLLFGIILITLAIVLRWAFNRNNRSENEENKEKSV